MPFRLRSGKALGADRQEVVLTFKPVPHLAFGSGAPDGGVRRWSPAC